MRTTKLWDRISGNCFHEKSRADFKVTVSFFCILLLATLNSLAQKISPLQPALQALQPQNIFPADAQATYVFTDKASANKPAVFNASLQANSPLFTAEIFAPSPSHFNVQSVWKSGGPVAKGDVLLVRLTIRALYAKQESGEAVVNFNMSQSTAPFERYALLEMSIGPEWKTIELPFVATNNSNTGEASIGFTYGALAQKVEITNVEVWNFGQATTLAALPASRFTYAGREEGAAWRNQALKRIEELRTAPLRIKVVDAKGEAVSGANVQARLVQSDFIWGSSVKESLLATDGPDSEKYRTILKEFFNTAVIENGFKAGTWQGRPERKAETMKAFQWLEGEGFRQRGHNLVWPGWKFNAGFVKQTAERDTAAFRQLIENNIRSRMDTIKGRVIAWDVINELLHEKDFFRFLPQSEAVHWFKMAKRLDPKAQLFINEYAMLNNVASPKNVQEYIDTIRSLRGAGAPVEAIGVQGHVGRQPRNPAQVLTDLDLFTATGLPVQITEFDINMTDEELQADYTRDFLIACYSHPVVTGFTIWGFWQNAHWKPDAAMFREDWSAKPNAAVWREWVNDKWKTRISETSDAKGTVAGRGHLGRYEIRVTKDGKSVTTSYQLTKNAAPVEIKL